MGEIVTDGVLHACWVNGALRIWGEGSTERVSSNGDHVFAVGADELGAFGTVERIRVRLPALDGKPLASPRLLHLRGEGADYDGADYAEFDVHAATIPVETGEQVLDALLDQATCGSTVAYFARVLRMARHLVAQQRFVPMLLQDVAGGLRASWRPWISDAQTTDRLRTLASGMPPAACAGVDQLEHQPWPILEDVIARFVDLHCRRVLEQEDMAETIEGRDPVADAQIAWLGGLLDQADDVDAPSSVRQDMIRRVRTWIGALEERGMNASWRLCLRLNEPLDLDGLGDLEAPPDHLAWSVSFHLQAADNPEILLDATDIWLLPTDALTIEGRRIEAPQELLLAELGRASRIFKPLESALDESEPIEVLRSTKEAYQFLREVKPVLEEQGFGIIAPMWWDAPGNQLGARLRIQSDDTPPIESASGGAASPQLGLGALVEYHWEIAIGDTTLSLHEFEQLANRDAPLIRVGGAWVGVSPEEVRAAMRFIKENPGGEMRVSEAIRLAYGSDARQVGIPVLGLEASGWVSSLLGGQVSTERLPLIDAPEGFQGTLRPYQTRGTSWLFFLERFGLGACLADDMGLGKTIQVLALLLHERRFGLHESEPRPTLLIVPTSVVGNWVHETRRFAPNLRVIVHHGTERLMGDEFCKAAVEHDIVVTTYALAHRDRDLLREIPWRRIVLDEAQYIKNPQAKQTQAVRDLDAPRRLALTGTPVENRLSELWSIMEFLNPGYLGQAGTFRRRFAVPIERYRDQGKAAQLRGLVRPFVLRRLKTDPTIIADLPEKQESREYSHLTAEQAQLYQSVVKRMLGDVEQAEGIQRRGIVLAALIKLKQVCNHPSQFLKDASGAPDPSRSGKCVRLLEMLDQIIAEGDKALIFTQFRQMGSLLQKMLHHEIDREVLFLHGGTTQTQRQKMVERFQAPGDTPPILCVSLKAGGVGLNLTAATHVFHFDRWWNPAVENQATDRAYRIGQTRTVQVHKFVVRGTLEERIDEMLEQKTELADQIVGSGERWLTELSTDDLKDLFTLRTDAVDEGE